MTIYNGDKTFTGSTLDILEQMRDTAFGCSDMTLPEYLEFMCDNYYRMAGERIIFDTEDLCEKTLILFKKIEETGAFFIEE